MFKTVPKTIKFSIHGEQDIEFKERCIKARMPRKILFLNVMFCECPEVILYKSLLNFIDGININDEFTLKEMLNWNKYDKAQQNTIQFYFKAALDQKVIKDVIINGKYYNNRNIYKKIK